MARQRMASRAQSKSSAATKPSKQELAVRSAQAATANIASVVKPQARDRWSSASLQNMTPDRVMQIMRGVIAGSFVAQWELFDLMEETSPRLGKNLNELKRAVQKVDMIPRAFVDGKKPSALAEKKKEVLATAMNRIRARVTHDENNWKRGIYDVCDAFSKSISVQEILWDVETVKGGGTHERH